MPTTDTVFSKNCEHQEWTIQQWKEDIIFGCTLLGYNEWVHHQLDVPPKCPAENLVNDYAANLW